MRYAILAAVPLAATVTYFDLASAASLACLFGYWRLCNWVVATRHQDRWRWNAYRVLYSMGAGREDPGPWVEPIPLTLATEGGDS